jgi:hypothetical protein
VTSLLDAEIVAVWEAGQRRHPLDRALLLLRAATPGLAEALPVGDRDQRLLELHQAWFGDRLEAYVECPACDTRLELALRCPDLRVQAPAESVAELEWGDLQVRVRAPDSRDLAAVVRAGNPEEGLRALLLRCVEAWRSGEAIDPEAWPAELVAEVGERMGALAPGADLNVAVSCPDCGHGWSAAVDVVEHLWSQLSLRARGLLREVDALARAYGWSEAEILGLGETRRRAYLVLAQS